MQVDMIFVCIYFFTTVARHGLFLNAVVKQHMGNIWLSTNTSAFGVDSGQREPQKIKSHVSGKCL